MPALEIIGGSRVGVSAVPLACLPYPGDAFQVRNAALDSKTLLLSMWAETQFGGIVRVRTPKMHDNIENYRAIHIPALPEPLTPEGISMQLYPQDILIVEESGGLLITTRENVHMLIYYSNLPGTESRLIDTEALKARQRKLLTVESNIVASAVPGWVSEQSLIFNFNLLKANTDYAIIGYLVDAVCAGIRYRGADFGNIGLGGPGDPIDKSLTRQWFKKLSEDHKLPLIPVFNSSNAAALFIGYCQNELGAPVNVTTILAELSNA